MTILELLVSGVLATVVVTSIGYMEKVKMRRRLLATRVDIIKSVIISDRLMAIHDFALLTVEEHLNEKGLNCFFRESFQLQKQRVLILIEENQRYQNILNSALKAVEEKLYGKKKRGVK